MKKEKNEILLPDGWVKTVLEDCVHILDNKRVPINAEERENRISNKDKNQLYPYYGATGKVGWIDDFLFDEELLLLGEDGAPFLESGKDKAYLIRGKTWVNNHAHVLKAINGITTNSFLMHYLNLFEYRNYVTGTTRLKLNQARLRQIPIILPPLPEQQQIVAKIEELFTQLEAGTEALKRVRAGLKRYKASVLKAAVEGSLIDDGKKRQRTDSGLPEGWRWVSWQDISPRVTVGYVGKMKDEYLESGIPFLRSQNVRENKFDSAGLMYISPEFHEQISKSTLNPGDIVVVRSGSIGVSCVIPESLQFANCSDLVIIKKPTELIPEFGAYYMNSMAKKYIQEKKVGVALVHFNTKSVAEMKIPLPPLAEQMQIVTEVEQRLSIMEAIESVLAIAERRAGKLRQAVLKSAFEGRLV